MSFRDGGKKRGGGDSSSSRSSGARERNRNHSPFSLLRTQTKRERGEAEAGVSGRRGSQRREESDRESDRKKISRRLKRDRYRRQESRTASEVRDNIENDPNSRGSFIIDDIFKRIETTEEHFGKFGTISICKDLKVGGSTRKVKLEFYRKTDAIKALSAKHPKGINFYIDPFPESQSKDSAEISRPIKTEIQEELASSEPSPQSSWLVYPNPGNPKFTVPGMKTNPQNLKTNTGHSQPLSERSNHRGVLLSELDRPVGPRKQCGRPRGHRVETWRCRQCNLSNSGREVRACRQCGRSRPGNWSCDKCQEPNNTPDELACSRRSCGAVRRGNWMCRDPTCATVNWAKSLHCYSDSCMEFMPGAWTCSECGELNFRDNAKCYKCKTKSGILGSSYNSRKFEIAAEQAKKEQAFANIRKRQLVNKEVAQRREETNQAFGSGTDWGETFREIGEKRQRRLSQDKGKTAKVQNRLLAMAGQTAREPDFVDLALEEEEEEQEEGMEEMMEVEEVRPGPCKNANLEPLGRGRGQTAASKKSKLEMRRRHVGLLDDKLVERIQHGSEAEKQEILKKFNIIEVKPTKDIVEVDLEGSDDGETEANNNNSNHKEVEEDDDDIQIIDGSHEDVYPSVSENVPGGSASTSQQEQEDEDDDIVFLEK